MVDKVDPAGPGRHLGKDNEREVVRLRRAAQLRANLFKRKDQQREREAADQAPDPQAAPEDQVEVASAQPEPAPADAPQPTLPRRGRLADFET
jgi:hypothetical protein